MTYWNELTAAAAAAAVGRRLRLRLNKPDPSDVAAAEGYAYKSALINPNSYFNREKLTAPASFGKSGTAVAALSAGIVVSDVGRAGISVVDPLSSLLLNESSLQARS